MEINNNLMAMNAHRQLGVNTSSQAESSEKLSSGYRNNRAGDDAASLSISEKMRGQIRGIYEASRNSQTGISIIQTAEGALQATHEILQRMRELAVQSANDTNQQTDREAVKAEVDYLMGEVDRIAEQTEFNTQKLLKSGISESITIQIGANEPQTVSLSMNAMTSSALSLNKIDVSTQSSAEAAVGHINNAITNVSSERANLGGWHNRLEHTIKNLDVSAGNLNAVGSITDADMAKKMMGLTKVDILNQSAQAMLAQANQAHQGVLQLLR